MDHEQEEPKNKQKEELEVMVAPKEQHDEKSKAMMRSKIKERKIS